MRPCYPCCPTLNPHQKGSTVTCLLSDFKGNRFGFCWVVFWVFSARGQCVICHFMQLLWAIFSVAIHIKQKLNVHNIYFFITILFISWYIVNIQASLIMSEANFRLCREPSVFQTPVPLPGTKQSVSIPCSSDVETEALG